MDLKRWTRLAFVLTLTGTLFAGGLVLSTEPAEAIGGSCPIKYCPSNLTGWYPDDSCLKTFKNGDVSCCQVFTLSHPSHNWTGSCYKRTGCIPL